jgi:hypothetical protein
MTVDFAISYCGIARMAIPTSAAYSTFTHHMPKTVSKRRDTTRAARRPLSKDMLLPLPVASVRACQLENHIAFAALQQGQGNIDLVGRLLKVVYLTYFLRRGYDISEAEIAAAEEGLKMSMFQGYESGCYSIDETARSPMATVLAVHDAQISRIPHFRLQEATDKLVHMVGKDIASLILLDAHMHGGAPTAQHC